MGRDNRRGFRWAGETTEGNAFSRASATESLEMEGIYILMICVVLNAGVVARTHMAGPR